MPFGLNLLPVSIGRHQSIVSEEPELTASKKLGQESQPKAPAIPKSPGVVKAGFGQPRLRPLPRYHPASLCVLRLPLDEYPLFDILNNLSSALRIMSIQPKFFDDPIAAALLTKEYAEMYLSLWQSRSDNSVMIEVQHRKGDAVAFKRYAHSILEATRGRFNYGHPWKEAPLDVESLRQAESVLAHTSRASSEEEEAFVAFESVHSLLSSASFDARCLGLESLCVFTDPRRTSIETSILFSLAVLSARAPKAPLVARCKFIHRMILELVILRKFEDRSFTQTNAHADSDTEDLFPSDDESPSGGGAPEYAEFMSRVFHLSLTVVVNSIEVVATFQGVSRLRVMDTANMAGAFLDSAKDIHDEADVLRTMMDCIRKAERKYHNAYLAARGLRFLCLASPDIRLSLIDMGALEHVARAHQIGTFNHSLLEEESKLLWDALHAKQH